MEEEKKQHRETKAPKDKKGGPKEPKAKKDPNEPKEEKKGPKEPKPRKERVKKNKGGEAA